MLDVVSANWDIVPNRWRPVVAHTLWENGRPEEAGALVSGLDEKDFFAEEWGLVVWSGGSLIR